MQKVLRAPTAMLAAVGPNDAGQAPSAQAHQRAQGLPHRTLKRARLGEHLPPAGGDVQEGRQESHGASGRRAKVFFSVRKKRSWRPPFLVREETRLSRSTVTPKAVWMRSKSSETWSGDRAFLSTSYAMSTWDRPFVREGRVAALSPWRRRRTARS